MGDPHMNTPHMDDLLHPRQVAERYGIVLGTLANWRRRGDGPSFVRINRKRVMYRLADVIRWEQARAKETTT